MNKDYLFKEIQALCPDEIFHPIDTYALKWQPPRCKYIALLPLNDPQLQENMLIQLHNMLPSDRKKVIFFFSPINPTMSLFAPRVHPASLVSYRTNDQVLQKLCDQYMEGRIGAEDFQNTLTGKYDVWRMTVFNLLPADEQPYHLYLSKSIEIDTEKIKKDLERQYLNDVITLQQFDDLKFPDRKAARDAAKLSYPRPYETGPCVVCSNALTNGSGTENSTTAHLGIIKCPNCDNLICVSCIKRLFTNEATKEGSFLLMHRRYCLRLGRLPEVVQTIVTEPAFLRELRATGRSAAIIRASKIYEKSFEKKPGDDDDADQDLIDEEALEEAERRRQAEEMRLLQLRIEEELRDRQRLENPPELQNISVQVASLLRKAIKYERQILEHQTYLDAGSTHTEQFNARMLRLRDEGIEKLTHNIERKLNKFNEEIVGLALEGQRSVDILAIIDSALRRIAIIRNIHSIATYREALSQESIAAEFIVENLDSSNNHNNVSNNVNNLNLVNRSQSQSSFGLQSARRSDGGGGGGGATLSRRVSSLSEEL